MSTINDIEIVNRVLEGDRDAFAEIIKKYQNMVFRYVIINAVIMMRLWILLRIFL
jgi:hypothetical protein